MAQTLKGDGVSLADNVFSYCQVNGTALQRQSICVLWTPVTSDINGDLKDAAIKLKAAPTVTAQLLDCAITSCGLGV